MSAEKGWIGQPQPVVEWQESHYSRTADKLNFTSGPTLSERPRARAVIADMGPTQPPPG